MALDTYTTLQTAIGDWLNRTDLTSQIPDFITLAEAKLKATLRLATARQQYSIAQATWTMPAEIDVLRAIRLVTGSPGADYPLDNVTPEDLAGYRALISDTANRPQKCTIIGRDVLFAPTPDQAYTIEVVYDPALTPLSANTATNTVLAESPGLYLYGALLEAAPYLEHDERVAVWQAKYDEAVANYNTKRDRERHSASLRPARLPVVF